jgi:CHAT domain-containing protein
MPVAWATTQNNLANAYYSRIRGERAENLERAIAGYEGALQVRTHQAMPVEHRQTQRNLGNLALAEQRWPLAADAFQGALAAGELLYAIAATPEVRQAELREVGGLPAACAYALARQHEEDGSALPEAVVTLERNRARWLAESLALRSAKPATAPATLWQRFTETAAQIQQLQTEAQLPDDTPGKRAFLALSALLATARAELTAIIEEVRLYAPEFMPEPSFADIEATFTPPNDSESAVGIYLLTTSQGGLALLVYAGRVLPVWLGALTDETLRNLLDNWLEAYGSWLNQRTDVARKRWFEQVDAVTGQLWELAMGPVSSALEELNLRPQEVEQPPIVTLIPTGLLALLPLHAAWTEENTEPSGRRYFLDDFAMRYAPSATALRHSRKRVSDVNVEHLVALDEPKPIEGGGPLPNSSREVRAIAGLFPAPTVLQHEQASRAATLETLATAQVAHFSCHGANNWRNPLDSGLLLANDELLTVRDFLELHLPAARLATLSACETGMVGAALPDEVIMLPSALVQAGYAGVVASLWSVADVSTAMLMVRFYHYWREDDLEPVYALRAAQRWVRDTTNGEKAAYFGQFVPSPGHRMAGTVAAEFFNTALLSQDGLEARSFAHPFWWGAFYLTGV